MDNNTDGDGDGGAWDAFSDQMLAIKGQDKAEWALEQVETLSPTTLNTQHSIPTTNT